MYHFTSNLPTYHSFTLRIVHLRTSLSLMLTHPVPVPCYSSASYLSTSHAPRHELAVYTIAAHTYIPHVRFRSQYAQNIRTLTTHTRIRAAIQPACSTNVCAGYLPTVSLSHRYRARHPRNDTGLQASPIPPPHVRVEQDCPRPVSLQRGCSGGAGRGRRRAPGSFASWGCAAPVPVRLPAAAQWLNI